MGECLPSLYEALDRSSALKKEVNKEGRMHSPAPWSSMTIISYVNACILHVTICTREQVPTKARGIRSCDADKDARNQTQVL